MTARPRRRTTITMFSEWHSYIKEPLPRLHIKLIRKYKICNKANAFHPFPYCNIQNRCSIWWFAKGWTISKGFLMMFFLCMAKTDRKCNRNGNMLQHVVSLFKRQVLSSFVKLPAVVLMSSLYTRRRVSLRRFWADTTCIIHTLFIRSLEASFFVTRVMFSQSEMSWNGLCIKCMLVTWPISFLFQKKLYILVFQPKKTYMLKNLLV